jgi:hypothetical protein
MLTRGVKLRRIRKFRFVKSNSRFNQAALSMRRAIRSRRLMWANRLAMAEWLRLVSSTTRQLSCLRFQREQNTVIGFAPSDPAVR